MPTVEATQVKCPECGARLDVPEGAAVTRCTYCGTESRVQRRTQFLQRPRPLIAAAPNEPVRVAQQVRSGRKTGIGITVVVLLVAVPIGLAVTQALGGLVARGGLSPDSTSWDGNLPTVVDVDGDGVDDFVGFDRNVAKDSMRLAAFSGTTGHALWETPSLGTYNDVYRDGQLAAGDTIVLWDELAHVRGFDRKTGAARWQITAPEVVKDACSVADQPVVVTADARAWNVAPATGALTPATATCAHRDPFGDITGAARVGEGYDATPVVIPGMVTQMVYARGPGPRIARGFRQPGTAVPMVAAVDDHGAVLWKADIPGHDALAVTTGGDQLHLALSDREVAVEYSRGAGGAIELTVFDRATGQRRFERVARKTMAPVCEGVVITRTAVALSLWGSLQVFDVQTGAPRFEIGG